MRGTRKDFLEAFRLVETVKAYRAAAEYMNSSMLAQGVSDRERELKVRSSVTRDFAWVACDVFEGRAPVETGWFLRAPVVNRPCAASEPPHE